MIAKGTSVPQCGANMSEGPVPKGSMQEISFLIISIDTLKETKNKK